MQPVVYNHQSQEGKKQYTSSMRGVCLCRRRVLEGDNKRRVGQLREQPKQGKKHIPVPEAVVLNECEGFRGRGRGLLTTPRVSVVLH